MDKFKFLKSKIESIFLKPLMNIEEKIHKDLNRIEDLKYIFYDLDKSVNEIINPLKQNNENEKKFKKINSCLVIETMKKKNSHDKEYKEETIFHNKITSKAGSPMKKIIKPKMNSSLDEKNFKTLTKDKALYDSKKVLTRNNYNNNSAIHYNGTQTKERNQKLLNTTYNNNITNEEKDFIEKVKTTHGNNDNNINIKRDRNDKLKKEGIEKLKKDLEKKASRSNVREQSKPKKLLNQSADNFADLKKLNDGKKNKLLPPSGKKESTELITLKPIIVPIIENKENKETIINPPNIKIINKIIPQSNNLLNGIHFYNNYDKCLTLFACSNYKNYRDKLNLVLYNKRLGASSPQIKSLIVKGIIYNYEKRIKTLEDQLLIYIENPELKEGLERNFNPSKTAQNGLNFVKTVEEASLAKKQQPEELIILFRLIYLLIGENYEMITPQNDLLQNLINNIYPKYGVENLKLLFLNFIVKNTNNLSLSQIEKIVVLCENNPKIFNSSEIMKFNKAMSFMCFIIKETFEFIKQKTEDGKYLICLRKLNVLYLNYKEKVEFLKKKL